MRRDDLYVADLADTTRAIREYLDSISRAQWDQDRVLRDAVLYRTRGEVVAAGLVTLVPAARDQRLRNRCAAALT